MATVVSSNSALEDRLLNDGAVVCSHLSDVLSVIPTSAISGRALPPSVVGRRLDVYRTIGQAPVINVVDETVNSLDYVLNNVKYFCKLPCTQVLLKTSVDTQPLVGLQSIIGLVEMVVKAKENEESLKGNVLAEPDDSEYNSDEYHIDDLFYLPSYITDSGFDFCAPMSEKTSANTELVCMFVPYDVRVQEGFVKDYVFDAAYSKDWINILVRYYQQAHFDLRIACDTARKHPLVFSTLLMPILGFKADMLERYNNFDKYPDYNLENKLAVISQIKPLIENISFDLLAGNLKIN